MAAHLIQLVGAIAAVYGLLLAVYFGTCLLIERLNRPLAAAKIQVRRTPPEQIRRDRRQSMLSLLGVAAMFGAGQWAYCTLGIGFAAPTSVAGTVLSLVASLLLFDAWFYWFHRLIHTRPFYAWVHRWHHLTVTPVAWSNNSDRLVDNLFLQSYWLLAHLIFPIAPAALLVHKLYDQVTGVIGHCGYEHGGRWCRPPSPLVGVTHHDQHHRYFLCNYATHFTLWDRLMRTLHPEHDTELRRNLAATAAVRRGIELAAD
jgi:sterol desaturase/sphingolipid hydroxylase (fatty acid hydroxylase superfamily)